MTPLEWLAVGVFAAYMRHLARLVWDTEAAELDDEEQR